jgi:hypothetical protein
MCDLVRCCATVNRKLSCAAAYSRLVLVVLPACSPRALFFVALPVRVRSRVVPIMCVYSLALPGAKGPGRIHPNVPHQHGRVSTSRIAWVSGSGL